MFDYTINKAAVKFNNKFNYSKAVGTKVTDKIIITCPVHGEFIQELRIHLRSNEGCPKCARETANNKTRKTQAQFIEQALAKHNAKYTYNNTVYINDTSKVIITCPIHGDFEQSASSHLQGCGCRKCSIEAQHKKQKTSIEQLQKNFVLPEHITVDFLSYKNNKTKMECHCEFHGPFKQLPEILAGGKGICPTCAKQLRGWNRSLYKDSPTTLYLLELPNNLYKVGLTKSCNVNTRYSVKDRQQIQNILFQVTILEGTVAWEIEKQILRQCKNNKYTGSNIFTDTGNTEIFTINPINIIKDILNERLF